MREQLEVPRRWERHAGKLGHFQTLVGHVTPLHCVAAVHGAPVLSGPGLFLTYRRLASQSQGESERESPGEPKGSLEGQPEAVTGQKTEHKADS